VPYFAGDGLALSPPPQGAYDAPDEKSGCLGKGLVGEKVGLQQLCARVFLHPKKNRAS